MPSAVFLAWTSFILAWPLAAASLAISVAAVACALTLSSSPIGRLPFLAPRRTHHGTPRPQLQPESQPEQAVTALTRVYGADGLDLRSWAPPRPGSTSC